MMTNKNSKFVQVKKYLALPVFISLAIVFTEKVNAKSIDNTISDLKNLETIRPIVNTDFSIEKTKSNLVKIIEPSENQSLNHIEKQITDVSNPVNIAEENIVAPEFPGGINEFRKLFVRNFDSSVFKGKEVGTIKTEINFTIETDGSVHNITAKGENEIFNKEAVKSVKLVTENIKWIPTTKDGKAVPYTFRLPMTMSF